MTVSVANAQDRENIIDGEDVQNIGDRLGAALDKLDQCFISARNQNHLQDMQVVERAMDKFVQAINSLATNVSAASKQHMLVLQLEAGRDVPAGTDLMGSSTPWSVRKVRKNLIGPAALVWKALEERNMAPVIAASYGSLSPRDAIKNGRFNSSSRSGMAIFVPTDRIVERIR